MLNFKHIRFLDIIKTIEKGDTGEVFVIYDDKSKKKYLCKLYYEDFNKYPENVIKSISQELTTLTKLNHPSINPILGHNFIEKDRQLRLATFSEHYDCKSLKKFINEGELENYANKMKIIQGIVSGMLYLHSKGIVHQNLKTTNIFINEQNYDSYICDFYDPISKIQEKNHLELQGTSIYTAPEIWSGKEASQKSDVYSFSIILYEIFKGEEPFKDLNTFQFISNIIRGGRPSMYSNIPGHSRMIQVIPDYLIDLVKSCWSSQLENRPTFEQINETLHKIDKEMNGNYPTPQLSHYPLIDDLICGGINDSKNIKLKNKIDLDAFEKENQIGEGNFGFVYKVKNIETGSTFVAKVSKKNIDLSDKDDQDAVLISREIEIQSHLHHPLIMKFFGYSPTDFNDQPYPVIISEFVKNGSLSKLLDEDDDDEEEEKEIHLLNSTKKLINIYGIASAMLYLHSHDILHLDLKAENVLVDENFFPKLSDFGFSKYISNEDKYKTFKGTPTHIAPEIWIGAKYAKPVDVYAFGLTVFEIMTNEKPFSNTTNISQIIFKVTIKNRRPKLKEQVTNRYRKLIEDCWAVNPSDRPSFEQIVDSLRNDTDFITEASVNNEEYSKFIEKVDQMIKNKETSSNSDSY